MLHNTDFDRQQIEKGIIARPDFRYALKAFRRQYRRRRSNRDFAHCDTRIDQTIAHR